MNADSATPPPAPERWRASMVWTAVAEREVFGAKLAEVSKWLENFPSPDILVLKPSALGDFRSPLPLQQLARQRT